MPTEFIIAWVVGSILSMIMFLHIDRAMYNSHKPHSFGFGYSLFLSAIFGLIVGYAYVIYLIGSYLSTLWNKAITYDN